MSTDMHDTTDAHAALIKLFWVWLWVGISQMTPLQAVQFLASIVAICYSMTQMFFLIRDRIKGRKPRVRRGA